MYSVFYIDVGLSSREGHAPSDVRRHKSSEVTVSLNPAVPGLWTAKNTFFVKTDLTTKFQLEMSTEREDLLPSRKKKHRQKDKRRADKEGTRKRKRQDQEEEEEEQAQAGASSSTPKSPPTKKQRQHLASNVNNHNGRSNNPRPPQSPFCIQTTSLYLPLSPIAQRTPLEGLCAEHLSPLILTHYPPFKGVVLSYSNVRLSSNKPSSDAENANGSTDTGTRVLARAIDEYAVTFVWVTADFVLLKPEPGVWMEGYVNVQSESHVGLVCWNMFNASIAKERLPSGWRWVGGKGGRREVVDGGGGGVLEQVEQEPEGYFVDEQRRKVEGLLRFRVMDFESLQGVAREKGFISIEGTLIEEEEEDIIGRDGVRSRYTMSGAIGGKVNGNAGPHRGGVDHVNGGDHPHTPVSRRRRKVSP